MNGVLIIDSNCNISRILFFVLSKVDKIISGAVPAIKEPNNKLIRSNLIEKSCSTNKRCTAKVKKIRQATKKIKANFIA